MSLLDVGVYGTIAAVALLPFAGKVKQLVGKLSPKPAPAATSQEWRQRWSATIIDLIDEVEDGDAEINRPETVLRLARELVWEIIGCDQPTAKAK
jgi:hypothetical protein